MAAIAALTFAAAGAELKRVLIVYGPASHGWNEHAFPEGAALLADCLNEAGLPLRAEISAGWPRESEKLEGVAAIVLYSDGLESHVARGEAAALRRAYEGGAGIVALHFALEAPSPMDPLHDLLLEAVGGAFEVDWSVNPVWELRAPELSPHAITRGVDPFQLEDEWYFHLRHKEAAGGFIPLLTAAPPESVLGADGPRSGNVAVRRALADGAPQTLAWAKLDAAGRRGFGFTGGHYHHNWAEDDFRTLVLNGIVWTAGLEVPEEGVASRVAPIPHTRSIAEAIARGNLADIRRHVAARPEVLNAPAQGGLAPLHLAVMRKKADATALLLELGAEPSQRTPSEETPLHLAVNRRSAPIAELLLERGAEVAAGDKNGWTAWHLAAAKDALDLIELFAERGHRPTQLSKAGGTPLHEAAASAGAGTIERLLELGVDPSVVSGDGRTALDIAVEYENQAAIEVLRGLHVEP